MTNASTETNEPQSSTPSGTARRRMTKLEKERAAFVNWFKSQPHREWSVLKVAWETWKQRAGVKA